MSTGWTAPGSSESSDLPAADHPAEGPATGPGPVGGAPPDGPRRELVQSLPLFPLRPLGLGEVLGAAVRIYRLRARTVLSLAAAVYGVAYVILTLTTGAGLIPMMGDMQALMEDPTSSASSSGTFSASDTLVTVGTSVISGVITMLAASLVTAALTAVAIGEATGHPISGAQMRARTRTLALPAIGISILVGLLTLIAVGVPTALGVLPLVLVREASVLTIGALLAGLGIGVLAAIWVWARTILAIPALVIEDTGVLGSIARAFRLTAGRKLWRVLGIGVLLYVIYTLAVQVFAGVFGFVAGLAYFVILLASSMQAIVLGMMVLTVISMLGTYLATVLLAPFLSAGFAALYADNRMRHEAWDVELTRRARQSWDADGGGGR
ncbi:MAG: glycerophosphodiester phosphodiesterase [Brachybacterium sp.]|uniref:glycerophosphodiester phosphodiesterase n=1 Tax=Brachybacterium sp. TaxID=1891286 RepID=UPI00264787EA|nr:glycerophosphodiester phosphodiesterase [Brachybacterium sp.]MDN5686324.1 glycerophosphodiester phosphodiesterase [Brachybacterium sp.]